MAWQHLLVFAVAMAGAQQLTSMPAVEDVVVTARPGPPAALLEPIEYLRRSCYDPMRLTGGFAPPDNDADWAPLEPALRSRFGVSDPGVPAFGLNDPAHRRTLLLKFERVPREDGLVEARCTLVVIGGADHPSALVNAIAKLMGGPGTQRHVGQVDGEPKLPGWTQWLWTSGPARGAQRWNVVQRRGAERASGTWLVVVDPLRFYADRDYVFLDLKLRDAGRVPLSMVTLGRVTAAARR